MRDISNAILNAIEQQIIHIAGTNPIIAWILLYTAGLFVLFVSINMIKDCFVFKQLRNKKTILSFSIFVLIYFFFLIKFTIHKSDGYLIYFCIFSWISTFAVIIWALIPEKFISNEPQHKKPKNQKN